MTGLTISTILALVGDLKDNEPAQKRFRDYLEKEVEEVGLLRDFINECLANTGEQYTFAFQDLVVYLGKFLGFKHEYGRYRGVKGALGHDGLWMKKNDLCIVIEVKKTEVYAIKNDTLIGYVERLISERKVSNWDSALGLYVVGKLERDLKSIENSIVAENRTNKLRIISAEALMSLAEIYNEFDVNHDDVVSILKPAKPFIDPTIDLLTRVVQSSNEPTETTTETHEIMETISDKDTQYWITPVKGTEEETAEECIKRLVGEEQIYAFGERTPGRTSIKVGDNICFYAAAGIGVVGHAVVTSQPEKKFHKKVKDPVKYPWVFKLKDVKLYLNSPTVIDATLRSDLDAFKDKKVVGRWAWFVQATHKITARDFALLTRSQ
jgi:hypothetical protein